MPSGLCADYQAVVDAVREAAVAAGRDPASVRVLAVSKTFPGSDIAELYRYGCRMFGESRVQELLEKAASLPADIEWHLIGQLQANKVRKALSCAALIHSVDSAPLMERLDRIAEEEDRHPGFLIEVNVSGETSKSGCSPELLPELALRAASCRRIRWRGLMTMAPEGASEALQHEIFGALRRMRDDLAKRSGLALPELSMGMSGDWRIAVEEGATIVRIGSAIFGRRARPV